jgi:hypothetical protein
LAAPSRPLEPSGLLGLLLKHLEKNLALILLALNEKGIFIPN